jgi:hypothetical protein
MADPASLPPSDAASPCEGLCGVCLAPLRDGSTALLECGHRYHALCAINWFRTTQSRGRCPLCRARPPDRAPSARGESSDPELPRRELMSLSFLHRLFSPWIYCRRRSWDSRLQALVSSYMACRRRWRRPQSDGARARAKLVDSAESLLVYLVICGLL